MESLDVNNNIFDTTEIPYIKAVLNKLKSEKAKKNYLVTFQSFKMYLDHSMLNAASEEFKNFLDKLKEENGSSDATLETKYSQLYRLYQYLLDNRVIENNPLNEVAKPVVTRNVRKERTMTETEMNKYVAAANTLPLRERSFILLIVTTGMQLSEVASINWCDFVEDAKNNIAAVIEKRKRGKYVKIPKHMWELLCDYRKYLIEVEGMTITNNSPVFLNHRGDRISETYIQKTVKATCKLAGIPVHPPKDLRHSVAKFSILSGSSMEKVGDMLGFSDDFLIKRYNYVLDDIEEAATDNLFFKIKRPGEDGEASNE